MYTVYFSCYTYIQVSNYNIFYFTTVATKEHAVSLITETAITEEKSPKGTFQYADVGLFQISFTTDIDNYFKHQVLHSNFKRTSTNANALKHNRNV